MECVSVSRTQLHAGKALNLPVSLYGLYDSGKAAHEEPGGGLSRWHELHRLLAVLTVAEISGSPGVEVRDFDGPRSRGIMDVSPLLHLLVWGLGFADQVTEPLEDSTVAPGMRTPDF